MNSLYVRFTTSEVIVYAVSIFLVIFGYFYVANLYIEVEFYYVSFLFFLYSGFVVFINKLLAKRHFNYPGFRPVKYLSNITFFDIVTFLTPDFFFTYLTKAQYIPSTKCKKEKEKKEIEELKGKLLISYNYWNFFISFAFVLLVILGNFQHAVFIFLLLCRTFSRSLEIIFSFTLDVITEKRTSSLQPSRRLSLAIISYIELIILYGGVYSVVGYLPVKEALDLKTFIDNLILSTGYITFTDVNFSYYFKDGVLYDLDEVKYFSVLQVITGFTLVIFAIASYVGEIKKTSS